MSRWVDKTPEQKAVIARRSAAWSAAHPEKVRARVRRWQAANREKSSAHTRKWQAANPEKVKKGNRVWKAANPNKVRVQLARRRACGAGAAVPLTPEEQAKVIGIYAEARALTEMIGTPYHVDHIIPLSKGGLHHPSNLQVLRGIDNLRKGAKL